jgi:hypothetical protein
MENHVNLNSRRCEVCNKVATYGTPGSHCTRCPKDRLEGMTTAPTRRRTLPEIEVRETQHTPTLSELPCELAELLNQTSLPAIRMVNGKYVLVDIGAVVLGKNSSAAGQDFERTHLRYPELITDCDQLLVSQKNHQPVLMYLGDLTKVVEYIMLLPGKLAAKIRVRASRIFVRHFGGDLSLIDEIKTNRRVQEHLAEVDPDCWQRAFGEAVELPIVFDESPGLTGAKHLYALQSNERANLWKIGKSEDPMRRHQQLQSAESHSFNLRAIWKNEESLETATLRAFPKPADAANFKTTELRLVETFEALKAVVDHAREQGRIHERLRADEPDLKRRRVEIELAEREVVVEERRMNVAERAFDLEKARWKFEQTKCSTDTCAR